MLSSEVDAQRLANPGLTIFEFDAERTFDKILADPSAIGISNVTGQACDDCGAGRQTEPYASFGDSPTNFSFLTKDLTLQRRSMKHSESPPFRLSLVHLHTSSTKTSVRSRTVNAPLERLFLTPIQTKPNPRPWGPGIVQVEDGKLRFQTTGPVPLRSPETPLETGFMSLTWDASETEEAFANGYLRVTLRADTETDANLLLRGDVEALSGYLFSGIGPFGKFQIHRFDESGGTLLGEISDPAFTLGEDWIIEAGTVDDVIST